MRNKDQRTSMLSLIKVILALCFISVEITLMNADPSVVNNSLIKESMSKLNVTEGTCIWQGKTMYVGNVTSPDPPDCYGIECVKGNILEEVWCPDVTVNETCTVTFYDMSSRYPDCCPSCRQNN